MKIAVIGAGFGGLSAAAYLAKAGHSVTVFEKNDQPGGRAMVWQDNGFTFDLGPSWYMMPDVFEDFFADFGKKPSDFYQLQQLIPSYRAYFTDRQQDVRPVSAAYKDFDQVEPGAGARLGALLRKTQKEYQSVRSGLLEINGVSKKQFLNPQALKMLLNPELQQSYHARIKKYVHSSDLQKILEFMVVFMGGSPKNIPALYSLLSWVDLGLGIWYPQGGFGSVARGFEAIAQTQGAQLLYNKPVRTIITQQQKAVAVECADGTRYECDAVVANADYHHVETQLLAKQDQSYTSQWWESRTLSPSGVIGLVGVNKKLPLSHHSLFFDTDWDKNFADVFTKGQVNKKPLFYVCAPSVTDPSVAPKGSENLFILIPTSNQAALSAQQEEALVDQALARIAEKTTTSIVGSVVTKRILGNQYFSDSFNAYKGNAFGLAHTLRQSGPLRARMQSKKVPNLYFVGQYTNPGTGVPLVVTSGKVVSTLITEQQ